MGMANLKLRAVWLKTRTTGGFRYTERTTGLNIASDQYHQTTEKILAYLGFRVVSGLSGIDTPRAASPVTEMQCPVPIDRVLVGERVQ